MFLRSAKLTKLTKLLFMRLRGRFYRQNSSFCRLRNRLIDPGFADGENGFADGFFDKTGALSISFSNF